MPSRFTGLVAAPFTPFNIDGSVNLAAIPAYARFLKQRGVSAVFVCGTTGEGASLSIEERESVAEAWIRANELPVIVHVGHTALPDARRLSAHAAKHGAAAFAALAPFFFKPRNPAELADWCAAVASAAPTLPFYYYHIPSMTGVSMPVLDVLKSAADRIPNLAGVKYTHEDLPDFSACLRHDNHRFDLLFGRDEMLLEGTEAGSRGAVGSTYNYASPLYLRLLAALAAGDRTQARTLQDKSISMIAACNGIGVTHLAASKALMAWLGVDCGPVRMPLAPPSAAQLADLHDKLNRVGFFDFADASQSVVA
ncbi:MAG: dihydrodipicolinate synthase family protein [Opitutaceae bacterium]|jgi:N-acetylneuraminate lyase